MRDKLESGLRFGHLCGLDLHTSVPDAESSFPADRDWYGFHTYMHGGTAGMVTGSERELHLILHISFSHH